MKQKMRLYLFATTFLLLVSGAIGQSTWTGAIRPPDAAMLYQNMTELANLGTVMYIAAHPDDENTRLISWFSRQRKVRTVYLSLTRGDGGQNLIGDEFSEKLGVLRTQELLAARRVDGGFQWFTRANDFGYSRDAEETLSIWNRQEVLSDVVRAIRIFRPDILIDRFDANSSGQTHGHHTASAQLALEAFRLAGDPKAFPEQLTTLRPWQPRRIFFNTSWWFYGSKEAFDRADKSRMIAVDAGAYEPWSGFSTTEIAALSRSEHRCQGFGSELSRGTSMEYLDLLDGDLPPDLSDPLSGLDVSWSRIPNGETIGRDVDFLLRAFDFRDPQASIPGLAALYDRIQRQPDHPWKAAKLEQLARLIVECAGMYAEWHTSEASGYPGGQLRSELDVIRRTPAELILSRLRIPALGIDTLVDMRLPVNESIRIPLTGQWKSGLPFTAPYWLLDHPDGGIYHVDAPELRGRPESPNPARITMDLLVGNAEIELTLPLVRKRIDPAFGERNNPYPILPEAFVTPDRPVAIFASSEAREIRVTVRAGRPGLDAVLEPVCPSGWTIEPSSVPIHLDLPDEERQITLSVTPPSEADQGLISFRLKGPNAVWDKALAEVKYDHIPDQQILLPSEMKLVHIPLKTRGLTVGYLPGAGDKVPECLQEAGFEVRLLDDADLRPDLLASLDAIMVGIRAYNTRESLKFKQKVLENYVRDGGTLIVQYNTDRGLVCEPSPLPLHLSRDRVTLEDAPVRMLAPDHPVLNRPNVITPADFTGWVQERGLYFPDQWDPAFTPILESGDPGQPPSQGLLLAAPYGRGTYVYTGLSLFRQLPAGVPGAYRLVANLLALRQQSRP